MTDAVLDLLEQHFDTAFAVPDGIKKLRELILTLAMQGKLVSQDPNDQPANEFLNEIEEERQRLVSEKKIKKSKALPEIKEAEVPYELPQGWKWVRLGNITTKLTDGSHNPPKNAGAGYPMLSSQNINFGRIDFSNPSRYVTESDFLLEDKRTQLSPGDVLLTIVASLGRPAVVPANAPKFLLQRSVAAISSPLNSEFLSKLLSSPYCKNYYSIHAKGTAQKGIYLGKLSVMPIPLPPLSEQDRIVAKIDLLMSRCDELEKMRVEHEQKRIKVHTAAINQLLDTTADQSAASSWQFISKHFGELYSVKENVTELRRAILQLAVMGRLIPKNPNEKPASELLKQIEEEKQQLVKEGKIKKPKSLPEIKKEEIPYHLPQGWEWVRLNDFGIWKSGSTPSRTNSSYYGGDIPWVKSGEVKQGQIKVTEETITQKALDNCSLVLNPVGSVLVAMYGANIGDVGVLEIEATTNQAICACRPYSRINNMFLMQLLLSLKQNFVTQGAGAAQPNISREKIIHTIVPLPPLSEQHRIVAKIDQLMAFCATLEQQIDAATGKQTELLNAMMVQL